MDGELSEARPRQDGRGVAYGLAAYALWGVFPFYFLLLAPAGAWEILAHRIAWSFVLCALLVAGRRQVVPLVRALRSPRRLAGVTAAGVLIAANWTIYLVAVMSGHVTDAALGYFLNPLVSVALGLLVLQEHLRPLQGVALAVGAAGGLVVALGSAHVPWAAFGLALSFGLYGLVKKRLGVQLSALDSLTAETTVLAPFALALLGWLSWTGRSTFASEGTGHALLLVSTGVATSVPLLLFAAAARRVTLVTIGLLQFVAPILQFACGLALGEAMSPGRWAGFAIVWVALLLLVADTVRTARARRRVAALAAA